MGGAFGEEITEAADFTLEGAQIAVVHINTIVEHTDTDRREVIIGRGDDDLVDGADTLRDFGFGDDRIALSIDGVTSFEDVFALAVDSRRGVELDFGGGDSLFLRRVDVDGLGAEDFIFVE